MSDSVSPPATYVAINAFYSERFYKPPFNSLGFNLLAHPTERRKSVAVFVHGWGGGGYKTWRNFLPMLFGGAYTPAMDVATFNYSSGIRTAITRGSKLDFDADRLANGLRELERNYAAVYIVGHSLGGLVAGRAVGSLLTHRRMTGGSTETAIAGMFLFASPRAGTGWANPLLGFLINEFRWLKRFSARCAKVEQFFTDHVQSHAVAHTLSHQFLIPRYAYIGSRDRIVNRFSAAFGVPTSQIMPTTGNHRTVVRPSENDHPQLTWLSERAVEVDSLRAQRARELEYAVAVRNLTETDWVVVTQLLHDPARGDCADIYNEVRHEASREGVLVQDRAELDDADAEVDLLMAVQNADAVNREDDVARSMLTNAVLKHRESDRLTVAVAPVGAEFERAADVIYQWLRPDPPSERFFVEGARDNQALRELIWRWVQRIVRRDPRRTRAQSSRVERFADPNSPRDEYFGRTDLL
jgi:hypothetical protein